MIDHVTFAVADFARAHAFYVSALAPLGFTTVLRLTPAENAGCDMAGLGRDDHPAFEYFGGGDTAPSSPLHIALIARTRTEVDAFHAAALAAGATDNGRPGPRPHYSPNYYAAFVRDPDGHNLEAVCHVAVE